MMEASKQHAELAGAKLFTQARFMKAVNGQHVLGLDCYH